MHYQMWIWSKFENVIAHFLIAMMEELIILYYVLFYMFLLMYYHYNDIISYKEVHTWEKLNYYMARIISSKSRIFYLVKQIMIMEGVFIVRSNYLWLWYGLARKTVMVL